MSEQNTATTRDRIVLAAYDLLSRRAIRDVGVDEIVRTSGVANATFYRHFSSKDQLVLAVMEYRERAWAIGIIEAQARERGTTPRARLLAIFDVFDEWFTSDDYQAFSFINVLLEMRPDHPLGQASVGHLANITERVRQLGEEAGLLDLDEFAAAWHLLMNGSIVAAAGGNRRAALVAKRQAEWLIDHHTPDAAPPQPAAPVAGS